MRNEKKLILFILLGILLCTSGYSQKDNKNFTLSVQENLIPFADFHYQNPTGHTTSQIWLNYIPSVELSFRNSAFARVRFNTLIADKAQDPQEIMSVNPLDIRAKYPKNRFAYSVSAVCGYNFLNKSHAHQLRLGLVVGFVHQTTDFYIFGRISHKDEITNHFQIGGEISYKYFIPKWSYCRVWEQLLSTPIPKAMMTSLHYQYQFEHYLSHTQFLSIAKQTIGEAV